jgi:excisionase family DNA binding protein
MQCILCIPCYATAHGPPPTLAVHMDLADSLAQRATALTVSDVASLLNISERQVYKLAADGRIDWELHSLRPRRVRGMAAAKG